MKTTIFFLFFVTVIAFPFHDIAALSLSDDDDIVFIHHSCGENWLNGGLRSALLSQDYIDEVNDIYYGEDVAPDAGRPDSLGEIPGDNTNMNHWIRWFNDYLTGIGNFECADGRNAIVMFKSCYPISNIDSVGSLPGNPFDDWQTLTNYKSVFRNYEDANGTYLQDGVAYRSLEQIFALNPDTLFIAVTAPPRNYGPSDETNNAEAQRAREFNNWLKNDWFSSYQSAHPGLNNVAVFDWFDVLAYPGDHAEHPNRLKKEYGGNNGDSHPNALANQESATIFAAFLDGIYETWAVTTVLDWNLY